MDVRPPAGCGARDRGWRRDSIDARIDARNHVITGHPLHVRPGTSPGRALHEVATELGAAAIVVGSSRRGRVGRVLAGSVTTDLLRGAPCPVVVAPRDYVPASAGFQHIGVGFIDAPEGRAALTAACELARASDGSVTVFNVMEPIEWSPALLIDGWSVEHVFNAERAKRSRATNAWAKRLVPESLLASVEVRVGDPASILAGASAGLDLLICGSRGFGRLRSVILGSVSRELAHSAACPLLVVPRATAEDALTARRDAAEAAATATIR